MVGCGAEIPATERGAAERQPMPLHRGVDLFSMGGRLGRRWCHVRTWGLVLTMKAIPALLAAAVGCGAATAAPKSPWSGVNPEMLSGGLFAARAAHGDSGSPAVRPTALVEVYDVN